MRRMIGLALLGTLAIVLVQASQAPAELKTTELGKGPTIVLVHGLGGNRNAWLPVARKLVRTHRVVMVDLPGHGQSPAPEPFALEACGENLAATLAKEDPKSTVLVGQGVGALIALHALNVNPKAAAGLVLIEGSAKSTMNIPDQQQKFFLAQLDQNYEAFIQMLYAQLARDSVQGVKLRADAMQVEPNVMKAYMRHLLKADASRVLDKLEMPVLFVISDKRMPEGKTWAEVATEYGYPHPERIAHRVITNSGSMIHYDQPDTLAAVLDGFSKQATGGSAK